MEFEIDKQTIKDLELFGEGLSTNSIFNFYNQTKTIGGKNFLWDLMKTPLTDIEELENRVALIKFFNASGFELNFNSRQFDFIEHYLKITTPSIGDKPISAFFQNLSYQVQPSNDLYLIQTGTQQLLNLLLYVKEKIKALNNDLPHLLKEKISVINDFIEIPEIADLTISNQKLGFLSLSKLDFLFRKKYIVELRRVISVLYSLDAYTAIANVAKQFNLGYPDYSNSSNSIISISKLYHPLLKNAIPYDVEIVESSNLCFLTEPNMAGKSTFLKSIGLSIYLSHLGFPVPAEKMTTTIYHGIMTTINLSDDMNKGYSHFYSEVRRVKEVALKLKEKENLFVIFDELFRGTNVKDAYDASLLIINAFRKVKKGRFFVSTHITEIADKLNETDDIQFRYFDSKIIDDKPVYEYKIREGVSHERLGLHIVENEKIVEKLNSITDD